MNLLLRPTVLCAIIATNLMAADDILVGEFEGSDYGESGCVLPFPRGCRGTCDRSDANSWRRRAGWH